MCGTHNTKTCWMSVWILTLSQKRSSIKLICLPMTNHTTCPLCEEGTLTEVCEPDFPTHNVCNACGTAQQTPDRLHLDKRCLSQRDVYNDTQEQED